MDPVRLWPSRWPPCLRWQVLHTYDYGAALQRVAHVLTTPLPGRYPVSEPVVSACARALIEDCADYYERAVRSSILMYRR